MRPSLASLANRVFDVAVIGGGINGASAAQHAAAAGYSVLIKGTLIQLDVFSHHEE